MAFEKEKTVDLSAWGLEPAVIKRLMYGEMRQYEREIKELSKQQLDEDDLADRQVKLWLKYTLVRGPATVDMIDWEAAAYIAKVAQEHNSPLVIKGSGNASASPTSEGHATMS